MTLQHCSNAECSVTWYGPPGLCDRCKFEADRAKVEAERSPIPVCPQDDRPCTFCRPDQCLSVMVKKSHTLPEDSAERKAIPLYSGLLQYFPAALAAAARVSQIGNDKHNGPGAPLQHTRGLSMDHGDCILRHLLDVEADYGCGKGYDDIGAPQVGYVVWRALAFAQEWLEEHEGKPVAPAAKFPEDNS